MGSFSALHAYQRIAGLHYRGKGANRTILDCLYGLLGWHRQRPAAVGTAGAGSCFGSHASCVTPDSLREQMRKGLES
jgi:hypothetical protein